MMVNKKDEIQSPPVVRVTATGKYSSEVLDKKIKKAEKMLDRSTPGSKDFKALQKKLIQYRTQLKQQKQQSDATVTMNGSFSVSESEGKEWPDEQEHGAINIDPLSAEVVEEEVVDGNEWKAKEQEDQNSHSLEILKKKLKKVEKMLHKSTPGSKEYKKLQKKRMEYGRKIREQDIVDNITDERKQKHRFQQSEAAGVVRGDTLQHQPRRSYQRYSEAVTRRAEGDFKLEEARQEEFWQLEKKAKELKQKEREQQRTNQSRRFEQQISEKKKVEDKDLKTSQCSIDVNYGEEERLRKQAYLEEARRLKQVALAKKRKEETLAKNKKVEEDKQLKKNSCPLNVLESKEIHSETSEVNEASKYVIGDQNYQRKKQAYLEEARRLKQEALEKIRKEEELQSKIETQENEKVYEKPSSLDISTARTLNKTPKENETLKCIFIGNDGETKKQTYLEEARQLKKEAMERKRKEENLNEKTQTKRNEEVKTKGPSSLAMSAAEDTQNKNLGECIFYNENQPKRQAYLEEAQSLKQEGISKKLEVEDSVQDGNDESQKAIQLEGGFIDNKIASINASSQICHVDDQGNNSDLSLKVQSERETQKEVELRGDSAIPAMGSTNGRTLNFLDEIDTKSEKKKENGNRDNSPVKPRFLDEIKFKAEERGGEEHHSISVSEEIESAKEGEKEDNQQTDFTQCLDPATHRKEPSDEIKSEAQAEQEERIHYNGTQFVEPATHKREPNFLDEIKSKAEGQGVKQQNDSTQSSDLGTHKRKPNFLDEIKSKAEEKKEDDQQNKNTSFLEFPSHAQQPNFLEEIRLKAAGLKKDEQQNESSQTTSQISHGKKGNFLQEIQTRVQNQNEEKGTSTCELNVFEKSPKTEYVEATYQKSEQTDKRRTENVKPQKEEESVAKLDMQQEEVSKGYLDKRTLPGALSNNSKKILRELEKNEIQQKKMEQSLMQNGIHVTEEIPYEEAKDKIADITESMRALAAAGMDSYAAQKEYFHLEEQLSKYTTALMLTDEYAEEHQRLEQDWEDSIQTDNIAAIHKLRSHMPINIRHLTEEDLVTVTTPNGKTLPRAIARKFKRTNILQLLRVDPDDIEMMHPSLLEGMRTTGLTLTERRALHAHFKDLVGRWKEKRSDPSIEKKWQWYQTLRLKFKETLTSYLRCVEKFGPPGSHQYAKRGSPNEGGCPLLGNQCPIKADAAIDYSDDHGYSIEPRYESSGNRIVSKKTSPKETLLPKEKTAKVMKSSEAEILQEYRDRLCLDTNETEADKKLLRELFHSVKRTKNIEKQLAHAGLSIPKEDISYDVAKTRIAELTEELNEVVVNMSNTNDGKKLAKIEHTFGALSQELDKYTNALMLTKEWAQEQRDKEHQWESEISAANYEALQNVRRHMPVNIRNVSEASLATDLTPNGKVLPMAIVKKFKRTNILMILRTDPSAIEVMHPSSLEAMRTTGLTLTERRAIHEHLKEIAPKWKATTSDKMCERKWMWHASLTSKFKEMLGKYEKQGCPVKSDLPFDYSGDYGFPEGAEYEQQIVAKSNLLSVEELEKRKLEDNYS